MDANCCLSSWRFYIPNNDIYVIRWDKGAEQLNGYEASEIIGTHILNFYRRGSPGERPRTPLIETAKTDGSTTDEGWRLREDGSRFWADVTLSASFDEAGTLRGFEETIQESAKHPVTR